MKIDKLLNPLALGLGIGVAVFGLVSLTPQTLTASAKNSLRITLDPEPSSIVRVEEGIPYTVPASCILVIKSIGDANGSSLSSIQVKCNGSPMVTAQMGNPTPATLGFPVTARAGTIVTVEETWSDPNSACFAAGYLVAY